MPTTRAWREAQGRRAERYGKEGRKFESGQMVEVLERMKKEKLISDYNKHAPGSKEDQSGKDFTVYREEVEKSFGVTISMKSWNVSKRRYPGVPQFLFPIGTDSATIITRITGLFS